METDYDNLVELIHDTIIQGIRRTTVSVKNGTFFPRTYTLFKNTTL